MRKHDVTKRNLISVDERIEDARAPVDAVLVNPVRLWVALSVESIENFDSVRQSRPSRCYNSRLQAVAYSALSYTPNDMTRVKFSN